MTRRTEGFGAGLEGVLHSHVCEDFVQVAADAMASARSCYSIPDLRRGLVFRLRLLAAWPF